MAAEDDLKMDGARYLRVFGERNLMMAGQQILKRIDLKKRITECRAGEGGKKAIHQDLTRLLQSPMEPYEAGLTEMDRLPEESVAVRYLRGFTIAKFADDFRDPARHRRTLNELLCATGTTYFEKRKVFLEIDLSVPKSTVLQEVDKVLTKARQRYGTEADSLPVPTPSADLPRMIERLLAEFDWNLFRAAGMRVGTKKALAESLYESSADPENALKALVRANSAKVMTEEYAWDLQAQHLGRG